MVGGGSSRKTHCHPDLCNPSQVTAPDSKSICFSTTNSQHMGSSDPALPLQLQVTDSNSFYYSETPSNQFSTQIFEGILQPSNTPWFSMCIFSLCQIYPKKECCFFVYRLNLQKTRESLARRKEGDAPQSVLCSWHIW